MVTLFCKMFCDPDVNIDRLVLSRIILSLITILTQQCDIRAKKILMFYADFLSKSK